MNPSSVRSGKVAEAFQIKPCNAYNSKVGHSIYWIPDFSLQKLKKICMRMLSLAFLLIVRLTRVKEVPFDCQQLLTFVTSEPCSLTSPGTTVPTSSSSVLSPDHITCLTLCCALQNCQRTLCGLKDKTPTKTTAASVLS